MSAPRRVLLLGATGSIGASTLEVMAQLERERGCRFDVIGLAGGSRAEPLAAAAHATGARAVALADTGSPGLPALRASIARIASAADHPIEVLAGDEGIGLLVSRLRPGDLLVNAVVGAAGLRATLMAVRAGVDVALANKESLVAGGALVLPAAAASGARIIPIDSEHAAVHQCLAGARRSDVRRIILTASGGALRDWDHDRAWHAAPAEALRHPTWAMGPKVTIDSATMMNKALEIIEAHWLFSLAPQDISAIMHPQSLVHGIVEFGDGSMIAQLGPADMRIPIRQALVGDAAGPALGRLDLESIGALEFRAIDDRRFPAIRLARRVLALGGTAGAIFNAANEAAVALFLGGGIPLGRIVELVAEAIERIPAGPLTDESDIRAADAAARRFIAAEAAADPPGCAAAATCAVPERRPRP